MTSVNYPRKLEMFLDKYEYPEQLRIYAYTHTHTHKTQFNLGPPLQIMYAHKAYNKMTSPLHNKSRISKQMNFLPHAKGEKEKDRPEHRVLSTHSDICLQRPALPVAGLN